MLNQHDEDSMRGFLSFIPGYKYIHTFLLDQFGLDITYLAFAAVGFWLLAPVITRAWAYLQKYFMAAITIYDNDEIQDHLLYFLEKTPQHFQRLLAETHTAIGLGPKLTPGFGSHYFWYNCTCFWVERNEREQTPMHRIQFGRKEDWTLSCFGMSTKPIEALLAKLKEDYLMQNGSRIKIYSPLINDMGRTTSRWRLVGHRACRPIESVVLDKGIETEIRDDLNQFLNPKNRAWYTKHGIPYRRAYLLYGPPGTGKSSLAFCLAGLWGLNIYSASVRDPNLTDETLIPLLANVPSESLVLLEDLDEAGVILNALDGKLL
ncbi:hypothetical protein B7494_g5194 [Chlorociboria aeruginascens]|nr:hypothetical protein B7494_g5194 [Chlorociboria aeruginascens]